MSLRNTEQDDMLLYQKYLYYNKYNLQIAALLLVKQMVLMLKKIQGTDTLNIDVKYGLG